MPLVSKSFSDIITFTRASSGTYFNATGTLQTATTNNARFDYDPSTLAARGMLVEEQRTNLLLRSEEFDNASWASSSSNTTVTANTSTAPDGAATADTIDFTNASSFKYQQILGTAAGTTYTFSVWLASGTKTQTVIRISGTSTGTGGELVVSLTPTLTRYSVTVTIPSGNSAAYVGFENRVAVGGGNGSTGTIIVWGAQLEAGAFPTSYIATTAASATRSADVASVTTLSPWYNASEGTLLAQYSTFQTGAGNGLVAFSDATINNRIQLGHSSGSRRFVVTALSATQCNLVGGNLGSVSANVVAKIAAAYKLNDFAASVDAGAVDTDTIGSIPSVNIFYLGSGFSGGDTLNGHIQRITYYPRRLSNAELQGITT